MKGFSPSTEVSPVSKLQLLRVDIVASWKETIREPMAMIGPIVMPTMCLLFFVVPIKVVRENALYSTVSVAQLTSFAVMVTGLFATTIWVAENRSLPFATFQRSLPASSSPRLIALWICSLAIAFSGVFVLVTVGKMSTTATVSLGQLLATLFVLLVTMTLWMLMGMLLGYLFSARGGMAVVQILMMVFAFGGGMFLPVETFPEWLKGMTKFFPSRAVRELVVDAATSRSVQWWEIISFLVWLGIVVAALVIVAKRDQGRRK